MDWGGGVSENQARIALSGAQVGIIEYDISGELVRLTLANNQNQIVSVDSILINGEECSFIPIQLRLGERRAVNAICSQLLSSPGSSFNEPVQIQYSSISTGASYFTQSLPMVGTVSRSSALLFTQVSTGFQHACAMSTNREMWCWGYNALGESNSDNDGTYFPNNPFPLQNVQTMSAGYFTSCAITTSGDGYCWGLNNNGQLGIGNTITTSDPTLIVGGHKWSSISAGYEYTCGITTNGDAYCWGENGFGQLGIGNTITTSDPTLIVGGHKWSSISAGYEHTCGITTSGESYCWGRNWDGQLGVGNFGYSGPPFQLADPNLVLGNHDFVSISAGFHHTCGVTISGDAFCWGSNNGGRLGLGNYSHMNIPTAVTGGHKFSIVSAGNGHTCGITISGDGYCWGENHHGALGLGGEPNSEIQQLTPSRIQGQNKFLSISASKFSSTSEAFTCGVTTSGDIYCWGYGQHGRLGINDDGSGVYANIPYGVVTSLVGTYIP